MYSTHVKLTSPIIEHHADATGSIFCRIHDVLHGVLLDIFHLSRVSRLDVLLDILCRFRAFAHGEFFYTPHPSYASPHGVLLDIVDAAQVSPHSRQVSKSLKCASITVLWKVIDSNRG